MAESLDWIFSLAKPSDHVGGFASFRKLKGLVRKGQAGVLFGRWSQGIVREMPFDKRVS
jgi:hypothetical protein